MLELTVGRITPAVDGAIQSQSARVMLTHGHGRVLLVGIGIGLAVAAPAPAVEEAVGSQPAGVLAGGVDGGVGAISLSGRRPGPVRWVEDQCLPRAGARRGAERVACCCGLDEGHAFGRGSEGAPAREVPAGADGAGVARARRDRRELPVGNVEQSRVVQAPALEGAVGAHPAGVVARGRDGAERSAGGVEQSCVVESPAFQGAVGANAAGVARPHRHVTEASPRRAGPRIFSRSPALERVVGAQPA